MPAGRPTDYTEALAEEICLRLAEGESLVSICREEGMPRRAAVFRWLQLKLKQTRLQFSLIALIVQKVKVDNCPDFPKK
jgi:hypothetical protein